MSTLSTKGSGPDTEVWGGIFRAQIAIRFDDELHGEIMARQYEGAVYLFANNLDLKWRPGRATIEMQGLKKGTKFEVIDEQRQIIADEGKFSDQFEPLGVRIYRVEASAITSPARH